MRIRTLAATAALAALLAAAPVIAGGVDVGAEAPEVAAGEHINTEPVKLSELKGRLVLLELFSTT